jgi:hypothetical protein
LFLSHIGLTRFYFSEIKQVGYQTDKPLCALLAGLKDTLLFRVYFTGQAFGNYGQRFFYSRQGIFEFMGDVSDKVGFAIIYFFEIFYDLRPENAKDADY